MSCSGPGTGCGAGGIFSRSRLQRGGRAAAVVIAITAVPDWMEPLPFALILFGPFLPDMQESFFERRYKRQLATLVQDMGVEQQQIEAYRPLDEPVRPALEPLSEPENPGRSGDTSSKEKV